MGKTAKGKDQRERIIKQALKCIFKYGLMKTNSALITRKLGIPQSLFFYYFPKQHLLYGALIEFIVENNRQLILELMKEHQPKTSADHLHLHIKGNILWALRFPEQVSVLLYGILDSSSKSDIRKLVTNALAAGEQRVYALINEGIAQREFSIAPQSQSREVAQTIHQQLIGSIIHLHTFRGEVDELYYTQRFKDLIKNLTSK